jgi:transcriptional regulator with XRE-family HTH domain
MNKEKKARTYTSETLERVLAKTTAKEQRRTNEKMLLAAKIADAIESKGWSRAEFAEYLGKHPSEISKWLSGTHNFTIDTILDIQEKLDIRIIDLEDPSSRVNVYRAKVSVLASIPNSWSVFNHEYGQLLVGKMTDFKLPSNPKQKAYA